VPAFEAQSYAFNTLGRQLLRENKIKNAIEVFKLNVEAYPASARAYESLADAYAADGNKDLAGANYRKALEINPQNTGAAEKLKKLD
jgi:Tfp pilus assembly protein PilF